MNAPLLLIIFLCLSGIVIATKSNIFTVTPSGFTGGCTFKMSFFEGSIGTFGAVPLLAFRKNRSIFVRIAMVGECRKGSVFFGWKVIQNFPLSKGFLHNGMLNLEFGKPMSIKNAPPFALDFNAKAVLKFKAAEGRKVFKIISKIGHSNPTSRSLIKYLNSVFALIADFESSEWS